MTPPSGSRLFAGAAGRLRAGHKRDGQVPWRNGRPGLEDGPLTPALPVAGGRTPAPRPPRSAAPPKPPASAHEPRRQIARDPVRHIPAGQNPDRLGGTERAGRALPDTRSPTRGSAHARGTARQSPAPTGTRSSQDPLAAQASGRTAHGPAARERFRNPALRGRRGSGRPYMPPFLSSSSSLISLTTASVVSSRLATEQAFWSATRSTLNGTITPILIMSPYSPVRAL